MKRINYESCRIPDRQQVGGEESEQSLLQTKAPDPVSNDSLFYEIEYDSCPIPGVGKYVLKNQKIDSPPKDEIRELFYRMRNIARENRAVLDYSRFFDKRVQYNNSIIFFKQGMFMKDFTDDYEDSTLFSSYFPNYQMMGYEQLRTYFTWRTKVREGNVTDTSLSYAFIYIYELINNIGVDNPQDGLDKLTFFWKEYSCYNKTIDKYIIRWLKDYHIYYELPGSFKEFVGKNDLAIHYPNITDNSDYFELFCSISKYDIRKSVFFSEDKVKLTTDCFYFVFNKLRQIFNENGIDFNEAIFHPTNKMSVWIPFKDALFFQWMKQPDRKVVLSEKEIYVCNHNRWTFSTVLTMESGRQLIGYVMKQMESTLRKITKYKYKLTANLSIVKHELVHKLNDTGLSLEKIINDAVVEFYREETKTIVKVDHEALSRIRQEALVTQEKLIIPEQEEASASVITPINLSVSLKQDMPPVLSPDDETVAMLSVWESFKYVLTPVEKEALSVLLHGDMELKKYADECGIMLEVLVDGINEKAMDLIGDNIMDDEMVLYEDYIEQLKELVE